MLNNTSYVVILTGPTACGKTKISLQLGEFFPIEIINVDAAQFYKRVTIGTAKPDWENQPIKHHCFDILENPENFNVCDFRKIILNKIKQVWEKKKIPVLVGGSLFYIKSLFFPPLNQNIKKINQNINLSEIKKNRLWNKLNEIDSVRAAKIHQNDFYRIKRALDIWNKTGIKPSLCIPKFLPKFNTRIFFIDLPKEKLLAKINKRTVKMIKQYGWLDEAEKLYGSSWEDFLRRKGFIGYSKIFDWIKNGKQEEKVDSLIREIQIETRQYAKRQGTFCRHLAKVLEEGNIKNRKNLEFFINISNLCNLEIENIIKEVKNDLRKVLT